jgi:hypothetical protein
MVAESADVFVQAGHEGRTSGKTGADGPIGREIDWTPIVASAATAALRQANISVIRKPADGLNPDGYDVKLAFFIHFDGDTPPCHSGASIGYNNEIYRPAADAWRALYSQYWKFRWMKDNFSEDEHHYYGFKFTRAKDTELLLELGEITCPAQAQWLKPRLVWIGQLLAHFAGTRLGKPVPLPQPLSEQELVAALAGLGSA